MSTPRQLVVLVLTNVADDWLIIIPLLLSIALIGPSHKRQYLNILALLVADSSQMSRCGMSAYMCGKYLGTN